MTVLDKIINNKKREVAELRNRTSARELEKSRFFHKAVHSLSAFILDSQRSGIIAEFKRKSPSGGIINSHSGVEYVTKGYSEAGASGLSILTDKLFFGGDCSDLMSAHEHNNIPILRKEFIIDEIQVIESKAAGADAILLIAAVLDKEQVRKFSILAHSLNMEVLLEVHSLRELDRENEYVNIIGVNNRDLNTLTTDVRLSIEMVDKISGDSIKISESGISSPQTVIELRNAGYDGFLIGETFMNKHDPVAAFGDFVKMI